MEKGKDKKEYIIEYDMAFVTILSLILLVIMVGITAILIFTNIIRIGQDEFSLLFGKEILMFFIVMLLWMVLHEIIHGIAYELKGANRKDIVYGVSLENGVFYCKCKEYINKKCIITSLLSPFILIGVVTYIIGIIFSNVWLIALSIVNISGAAGDLMMYFFFIKQNDDVMFRELGFSSPAVVKTSEDISKNKYIGIKNIREVTDEKEVTEGEEKKITISKASWFILIGMLILLIVDYLLIYVLK